jgi:hypothetical protein
MKNLTLISITIGKYHFCEFCYLPIINAKAFLSSTAINDLYKQYVGHDIPMGTTISYG